ncbi:hypothetical protein NE236_03685 [Actinoallomurus purpureus]|nr:hypothetical protein [Actinoallomurus purpureus]
MNHESQAALTARPPIVAALIAASFRSEEAGRGVRRLWDVLRARDRRHPARRRCRRAGSGDGGFRPRRSFRSRGRPPSRRSCSLPVHRR